jgi:hypothetical protein
VLQNIGKIRVGRFEGITMASFKLALVISVVLAGILAGGARAAAADVIDEPIQVTTFELKDGKKFNAVAYAALGKDDLKSYVITETNGERAIILEKEIVSRKKEQLAFVNLDDASRREVMRQRSASAAKKADADAAAKERSTAYDSRLKESAFKAAFNKVNDELTLAREILTNADLVIKSTPVDIARADARYDSAKTELAATGGGGYPPPYARITDQHHNDYLRQVMIQAAEDKAKADAARKDAEDVQARTREKIKGLEAKVEDARKAYDAAQAEAKGVIEKLDKAAADRAAAREQQFGVKPAPQKPTGEAEPEK